jgi:hypothetical protein
MTLYTRREYSSYPRSKYQLNLFCMLPAGKSRKIPRDDSELLGFWALSTAQNSKYQKI